MRYVVSEESRPGKRCLPCQPPYRETVDDGSDDAETKADYTYLS